MCRFALYLGPPLRISALVTEPEHSLIHQSFHSEEREEPLNGDGFGLAWYPLDDAEPAVFRSTTPAWNNHNLLDLARVVSSCCILAHVRAATRGSIVSESNCHPFRHGRYTFMHNGDIGNFSRIRRALLAALSDEAFHAIRGTTDSEHMFALFLDRLREQPAGDPALRMSEALAATIEQIVGLVARDGGGEPSYINCAVSDGRSAVTLRFTTDAPIHGESLYYHSGQRYLCVGGVCHMLEEGDGRGAVLVSSERLTDDDRWQAVPANHMVLIDPDRRVRLRAV
jgi:predicted glutamine amidotransferase